MVEAPELHVGPGFDSRHLHHTSLLFTSFTRASRGEPPSSTAKGAPRSSANDKVIVSRFFSSTFFSSQSEVGLFEL